MDFLFVFTFLFLLKFSLVKTESELSLNKLQKGKCADDVSWSLIDLRSTSVAYTNSSIALRSSLFSCASLLVDFTTGGTLDVKVYIQAASKNSGIEILIPENEESIRKYVYGKSRDAYAQGWYTISVTHSHQETAIVTFLGFSEDEDIVLIKSVVYNEGALLDKNRKSRKKRQAEDYDDSEKPNYMLESEEDSESIKIVSLRDIKSEVNDDKTTQLHNETRVNKNDTGQPMFIQSGDILLLNILREARVEQNESSKKVSKELLNETNDITENSKKEKKYNNIGTYDDFISRYEIEDEEKNDDGENETEDLNNDAENETGEDEANSEIGTGEGDENNGEIETGVEGGNNGENEIEGEDENNDEETGGGDGTNDGNETGGDGNNGENETGDGDNGETETEEGFDNGENETEGGDNGENETGGEDGSNGENETGEDGDNGENETGGDGNNGENQIEGEDGDNGESETGEDGNNGENETEGDGDNGENENTTDNPGPEPVTEEPSSFWNIWTITLISIGSATVVGIVIISAYYLGKMKGRQGTSSSAPLEIDDIEAPRRIIPRVRNIKPPYEKFGSEYGNSTLDVRD